MQDVCGEKMSDSYIKLYSFSAKPDCVYFLGEGNIFFYVSTVDKYSINGKNLIIGAAEVLVSRLMSIDTDRVETAVADQNSIVKKISAEKFLEGMKTYSFALNTSIVLAKQVLLTNRIINKNLTSLSADETKTKEYASEYYMILTRLRDEYNKRKLPWLKELVIKYEANLTYKRGEAYCRSAEPVKLTVSNELIDKSVEYKRGSNICEENTVGEEMYILQTGSIDVMINGNKVTSIDESGTVFGEMALLLGEKRTATLVAKNDVVITKILKGELKDVAARQYDLLSGIALALAKRHYFNIMKIGNINKTIAEKMLNNESEGKKPPQSVKALKELQAFKRDLESAVSGKDVSFIQDVLASL